MSDPSSPIQSALITAEKALAVAWKLGLLSGGICIFLYLHRVGHTLTNLTVSDGILLLLAAASFGLVYLLFVVLMGSIGLVVGPLLAKGGLFIWRRTGRKEPRLAIQLAKFHWLAIPPAIVGVLSVISFIQHDSSAKWTLPILAIPMYLWYSLFLGFLQKNQSRKKKDDSRIVTLPCDQDPDEIDNQSAKKALWLSGAVTVVLPLALGGVSGQLLDGAMRVAGFRIDDAIVYVKSPYSQLMPQSLALSNFRSRIDGYSAFGNTDVLFQGIGTSKLISFEDCGFIRSVPIPSESIFVERRFPIEGSRAALPGAISR